MNINFHLKKNVTGTTGFLKGESTGKKEKLFGELSSKDAILEKRS